MAISKTLGGDRLGSGNRMKQRMHNFERSNKNLSKTWGSTMAPGVLYPCYTNVAIKGDTFDIDLSAFARTIPTLGPLYGSFKLQVDFFQVPFRLYQAILHNNTTDIARKMNQVYLPKVMLPARITREEVETGEYKQQIHETALMHYLRQSGVCGITKRAFDFYETESVQVDRKIGAIPMLAYYDIFKNYYSNKQEENAYVISANFDQNYTNIESVKSYFGKKLTGLYQNDMGTFYVRSNDIYNNVIIQGTNLNPNNINIVIYIDGEENQFNGTIQELYNEGVSSGYRVDIGDEEIKIYATYISNDVRMDISYDPTSSGAEFISLQPFPLSNIDDMRKYLLTQWDLGTQVVISRTNQNYLPYSTITGIAPTGQPLNKYIMNGLVVKTYQSDWFNNWLDTEWVNEITSTSAIDVSNGSFTLDMLNFKKKLYDHLNRLAISGGTYDDWQEATYGDRVWGKSEKPIYCGGMSSEIEFDEVVSTAAAEGNENFEVLGTIAGRGTLNGRKGGHITIKVGEASVIMGIVSLTPRIMYAQGNAWFNTELDTIDDLHKPIFDRIGFQDLMVEQMAWWDAKADSISGGEPVDGNTFIRTSAGKQPAWMQYATDIDEVHGDFAREGGADYMVLTRRYESDEEGNVADVTTYIDPKKYNYPFAYQNLDAQNFWTFIRMKIHSRRKMSNTQIPNV